MTKVQLEELREVIHPAGKLESRAEHWAGRLYMRALSLRVTRLMLGTRVSPNQITTVMVFAGVLSGVALVIPGLGGAVLSVVFMQLYLLLDCVDGEVAAGGASSARSASTWTVSAPTSPTQPSWSAWASAPPNSAWTSTWWPAWRRPSVCCS